jgi:hypothetical protein
MALQIAFACNEFMDHLPCELADALRKGCARKATDRARREESNLANESLWRINKARLLTVTFKLPTVIGKLPSVGICCVNYHLRLGNHPINLE